MALKYNKMIQIKVGNVWSAKYISLAYKIFLVLKGFFLQKKS